MNMKSTISTFAFASLLLASAASSQTVRYEFTGGSMAPTVSGLPAGVNVSNFSLGTLTFAALSDNGGSGHSLRLSRGDVVTSSTTALAGPVLSFSLTIPAGVVLNLGSLALDFSSGGISGTEYLNARVFSSVKGSANPTDDTIGTLGRVANGADSGTMSVSLATPDSNPTNGSNSNNGDHDGLTNCTITFFLPFIRDSQTTATDYLDIDNITLAFQVAPPAAPEITGFTATAVSPYETALGWTETLPDETGFLIERAVTGSGVWESVITTAAGVTSIRDHGMAPGTSHTYRISAGLTGGGTSASRLSNPVAVPAVVAPSPLVIMPLGDSITEGAGGIGGYRSPLHLSLANAGLAIDYVGSRSNGTSSTLVAAGEIHHEGHGSYATTLLTGNLDGLLDPVTLPYGTPPNTNEGGYWLTGTGSRPAVFPDLILLMIGTNDLGMFQRTPVQVRAYYDLLLAKLVAIRPNALIVCSSVPPYTGNDFVGTNPVKDYSQREANNQAFNQMLPDLVASYQSRGHRVRFNDVRQKITPDNQATLIGGDGVHPTGPGYNAIAAAWFDAIKQLPLAESWRILHFGSASVADAAADAADPDRDGDSNLMEFALGTDPQAAGPRPIAASRITSAATEHLAITFPRRKHAKLRYLVEVSSDLSTWTADTLQTGAPTSLSADFEQVTFRDRQAFPGGGKRFIRVRVSP
ncbi:MAG: hypothetical protein EAZ65_04560 [Verrucomicrobia bacterium]|nr:MAG: hypothetical protein EAZ84_00775 [Verrucomicrobiota bacterium]TAE88015.1 MAG: hypothetical protein EAZ82_05810 [Verrucomicrobiota bacterium]TAF26238.1 MAG: hypothetical protein EAZ71_05375 [Verrucomicrobiota bacterium]TAF41793.1 MAG: hypothetical protein EAZ65_04560 [Verrucomicrobiota bacterium]